MKFLTEQDKKNMLKGVKTLGVYFGAGLLLWVIVLSLATLVSIFL